MPDLPTKPCAACGRVITWRKKWERDWDAVKFCSEACRRGKPGPVDALLEQSILDLLSRRDPSASICPSEAARAVAERLGQDWRPLMEPARRAARRLVAAGRCEITQSGRPVDPSLASGPIRVRFTQSRGVPAPPGPPRCPPRSRSPRPTGS